MAATTRPCELSGDTATSLASLKLSIRTLEREPGLTELIESQYVAPQAPIVPGVLSRSPH